MRDIKDTIKEFIDILDTVETSGYSERPYHPVTINCSKVSLCERLEIVLDDMEAFIGK
jgi:hypothetical protein